MVRVYDEVYGSGWIQGGVGGGTALFLGDDGVVRNLLVAGMNSLHWERAWAQDGIVYPTHPVEFAKEVIASE